MNRKSTAIMLSVFFWTSGWVCTGPAAGAEDAVEGSQGNSGKPASIFDDAQPASDTLPENAEAPAELPKGQSVKVGNFGEIDLHVKDLDLSKVLQLLSIQSQRNIIATRNVAGSITADLYRVDFYEALDAILQPNGLRYIEKGNFVYVYTTAEYEKIQQANRKTVTKVIRLNYITAADASTFVQTLLSAAGSISLSGKVGAGFIPSVSDAGANEFAHEETLVIRDYPEVIDEINDVIKELDVRPKQVLIEATILEAKLTEDNKWGVNMTVLANAGMSSLTNPTSAIADLLGGTVGPSVEAVQSTNNLAAGDSAVSVGIVGNDVAAFIDALDRVTDTTILANPKLLVLNRQRANLLVGERKGYVSTTQTDTASTQTIEFLETGTQLSVRPFVSQDNIVRMELQPSISTGNVSAIADFVVPNEQTEEVTTNVMVPSGQTVVIGGLFKEETTTVRQQVPWLGDIPLAGAAFKGKTDLVERNEFIFMITPTVMKDKALVAASDRVKEEAEMARVGAREGLLPWSRTKLTAAHMRSAIQYKEAGEDDKAMWCLKRALTMDSTFREARELAEEWGMKRLDWQHDSILRNATNAMIENAAAAVEEEAPAEDADAKADDVEAAADGWSEPVEIEKASDTEEAAAEVDVEAATEAPAEATEAEAVPAADTETATESAPADDNSVIEALDKFLPDDGNSNNSEATEPAEEASEEANTTEAETTEEAVTEEAPAEEAATEESEAAHTEADDAEATEEAPTEEAEVSSEEEVESESNVESDAGFSNDPFQPQD